MTQSASVTSTSERFLPQIAPTTPVAPFTSAVDPRSRDDTAVLAGLLGQRAARRLARGFDGIRAVALAGDPELEAVGLTHRQIASLRASVELGLRSISVPVIGRRITGPEEVATFLGPRLATELVEEFHAVVLDCRHRVTRDLLIARGSLTSVEVHPRDVFRQLIRVGAAAVIFAHNHPSGDPTPSAQDIALTARLREVGDLVGIPVLDHVVVGTGGRWRRVET